MKRFLLAAAVALSFVVGFSVRSLSVGAPRTEAAARPLRNEPDETEWEYCAVTKAQYPGTVRGNLYWIVYFNEKGVQVVDVEAGPTGNAQARAIAKVGADGWELVGEGSLDTRPNPASAPRDNPPALLFKRQKR